jgi:hypothetical protein
MIYSYRKEKEKENSLNRKGSNMKIWVVTEYILNETRPLGEVQNEGFYSSKENAIHAVYSYLLNDFDPDDVINRVEKEEDGDYITITTKCGDDYGMYDCRYDIECVEIDQPFGE